MPAQVIDLGVHRRSRRLREALVDLNDRLDAAALPRPEDLGWAVLKRDEEGRPTKVSCARYRAIAGYVPGDPDLAFLDFQHTTRAYAVTLEELLVGLETGFLPDPVAETTP